MFHEYFLTKNYDKYCLSASSNAWIVFYEISLKHNEDAKINKLIVKTEVILLLVLNVLWKINANKILEGIKQFFSENVKT